MTTNNTAHSNSESPPIEFSQDRSPSNKQLDLPNFDSHPHNSKTNLDLCKKLFSNFLEKQQNIDLPIGDLERIIAMAYKITCSETQIKNTKLKEQEQLKLHEFKNRELLLKESALKLKFPNKNKPELIAKEKSYTTSPDQNNKNTIVNPTIVTPSLPIKNESQSKPPPKPFSISFHPDFNITVDSIQYTRDPYNPFRIIKSNCLTLSNPPSPKLDSSNQKPDSLEIAKPDTLKCPEFDTSKNPELDASETPIVDPADIDPPPPADKVITKKYLGLPPSKIPRPGYIPDSSDYLIQCRPGLSRKSFLGYF